MTPEQTGGAKPGIKGAKFERAVVAYLREHGHPNAERAYGAGRPDDAGDIDGIPGVILECKNHGRFDLAGWIDQSNLARTRGGEAVDWSFVIAKRRGKPAANAYVLMDLAQLAALLEWYSQ